MYSREQLLTGLKKASDAGDTKSANEIASLLSKMDAESAPPPDPSVRQPNETYVEGVQRRYGASDFQTPLQEFVPEIQERLDITKDPMSEDNRTSRSVGVGLTQAARTGGELVMEAGSVVLPDFVRDAVSFLGESSYAKTAGYAISQGLEAYQGWAKDNPKIAEELETFVDIGALFSPRPDLINLDKTIRDARKAGTGAKISKEKVALTSLLAPEKLDTLDKTESQGVLNTETWVPDAFQEGVIDTVQTIPGINPYGTVHENFRVIQKYVESKRVETDRRVGAQNKKINVEDLEAEFDAAVEEFLELDVLTLASDKAKESINQMIESARAILKSEGNDLNGVLNARRRFDEANRRSGTNLDADVATYKVEAALIIRSVLNDFLKKNTAGDELHQLLDTQHLSLTALDRLTNKRNLEGKNVLSRFTQNVQDNLGVYLPASALSILALGNVAVGNLGLAAGLGSVTALGIAGVQIARHGKPKVLKAYATALSAMSKAIKNTNDPARLEVLELDRQVLVALMNDAREYEEEGVEDE
jgi:hypothetical protein